MMYFADFHTLVTSSSTIITVVVLLVALVLGAMNVRNKYASGQDSQTIKSLKNSNDAFKVQAEADSLVITGKLKELSAKETENKLLSQQNEVYVNTITQAPQINELAVQLATQHKEMMEAFSHQSDNIGKMARELGNVAKAVVKGSQDA